MRQAVCGNHQPEVFLSGKRRDFLYNLSNEDTWYFVSWFSRAFKVITAYLFTTAQRSKAGALHHIIGLVKLIKKLLFLIFRKEAGLGCIDIL